MKRSTFLKVLRSLLSFGIAFVLLRWVIRSTEIDPVEAWELFSGRFLILALLIYGLGFLVASFRWYLLLRHIQVTLSYGTVVRLAMIGQFFNLFVPGGIGGDVIKMVYLKKEASGKVVEAMLTVLLDRLLGLVGLLMLAVVAVGLNRQLFAQSAPHLHGVLTLVGLCLVGALLGLGSFVVWPHLNRLPGTAWVSRTIPASLRPLLARIQTAIDLLRSAPMVVLKLTVISMLGHFLATVAVFCIGLGLRSADAINFAEYLLATQLSNLVGAVPLTPGGLGGRDFALFHLLKFSGGSAEACGAIPLAVTLLIVVWSSLGGLALLWERTSGPNVPGNVDIEAESSTV